MKYRLTCLTPLLVGDGLSLSPIDYMVWKDHVNVLDQKRIFRLLAKGPRLDNYLTQLRRVDKLDFASWGGFAQNFAGRRIAFEHPSCAAQWERLPAEHLHIPTFSSNHLGPYIPGSAIKGALRTGEVYKRSNVEALERVAAAPQENPRWLRHPGEQLEKSAMGSLQNNWLKLLAISDSAAVSTNSFKVYLLRVGALEPKQGGGFRLGWKVAPKGAVSGDKPDDGTPTFAEMAEPGTCFQGTWSERSYYRQPEVVRANRWKHPPAASALLGAANEYAGRLLEIHSQYASSAGLTLLSKNLEMLSSILAYVRQKANACLLCLGWGGGFLGKVAVPETSLGAYQEILRQVPQYSKALRPNLPFPKTRRVVFFEGRPATLPGWALLELD